MLKIKDNVELKELEKFGFRKVLESSRIIYERYFDNTHFIVTDERQIHFCPNDYEAFPEDEELDLLFDLIQAGTIEKK